VLTGSDKILEHLNPQKASVWTRSEHGELTVKFWWITEKDSKGALYFGEGDTVGDTLIKMRESGLTGQYILHFSLEDSSGGKYELSRRLTIKD